MPSLPADPVDVPPPDAGATGTAMLPASTEAPPAATGPAVTPVDAAGSAADPDITPVDVAGASADPASGPVAPATARRCQNCGEPLLGEHCYACGQPTRGLVRHFSSIVGDFMDSVFELDSRILRTLGPLLFRPGYLSQEYFAGRRVRYVSPVRLFVFLSIVTFFVAQLSFNIAPDKQAERSDSAAVAAADSGDASESTGDVPTATAGDAGEGADGDVDPADTRRLRDARTVAEVERIRDAALAELRRARSDAAEIPGVGVGLDIAEQGVRADAERRIAAIRESERTGKPLPVRQDDDGTISFNGTPWDAESNPLRFDWLGDSANDRLNERIGRAQGNIRRIQDDPNLLKDAFLSTVPATLFVLLPLFALLLKVAYAFRRRLYMEHLIVALHSHAFLCAGLMLAMILDALKAWTGSPVSTVFGLLETATLVWLPLYLLLMQKRVYGQGWLMTLLKFFVLGGCYVVLIGFGFAINMMVSLVSM